MMDIARKYPEESSLDQWKITFWSRSKILKKSSTSKSANLKCFYSPDNREKIDKKITLPMFS